MTKLESARKILDSIGMPTAQQSELCCYVLLAMAGINEKMKWEQATSNWIRIHDIIVFLKEEFYKLKYCSTVVYMVPRA